MTKMPEKTQYQYIYCIIGANREKTFPISGMMGNNGHVYTVIYRDLAAVVSDSSLDQYPMIRENLLAHQKVMEKVMQETTVLPVRFSTLVGDSKSAASAEKIKEVLGNRYDEIHHLLEDMSEKVELGVKALWKDMKTIFQEIVEENTEIKSLKKKIESEKKSPMQTLPQRTRIGEMVKAALDAKKAREAKEILSSLSVLSKQTKENKLYGDNMILNAAFLVESNRQLDFENQLNKLASQREDRVNFKFVGPVPPCNFVELVISIHEEE